MKIKVIVMVILTGIVLLACAPKVKPPTAQQAQILTQIAPTPSAAVSKDWDQGWQKLVAAARREGTVVVYTTAGSQPRVQMIRGFKGKYGIEVDAISTSGSQLDGKIFSERRAGLYVADVYVGGHTSMLKGLKSGGAFDPLEPALLLPELTEPLEIKRIWWDGKLLWLDRDHFVLASIASASSIFTINTDFVKPEELNSYRDILAAKWKKNFVMYDPSISGTSAQKFTALGFYILGWDYVREFARQEPFISRDHRLLVDWVANGKYTVGFGLQLSVVNEYQNAGAHLKWVTPVEGTYLSAGSSNIALMNQAPHPNAAKLFINWFLSKEGQTLFSQEYGSPSARLDVTTEGLDPAWLLKPGVKYLIGSNEEFADKEQETFKMVKEIFGPLLK